MFSKSLVSLLGTFMFSVDFMSNLGKYNLHFGFTLFGLMEFLQDCFLIIFCKDKC